MFLYNLRIAAKSLRRNPILTALLVGAIALGICVSTTFVALRHILGKDPLPGVSHTIHNVRLDSWDPTRAYDPADPKSLPPMLTYRDMRELMKSDIPVRQTGTYFSRMFVFPDPKVGRPFRENVRMVFGDFFGMFRVPFQYGGPWDKNADAKPEQVVVLDEAMNQKLFGGANSVGKSIRIAEREYKVVGVMAPWRPAVRMYDLTGNVNGAPEGIYMPFNLTEVLELYPSGNSDGWKGSDDDSYRGQLMSEQTWTLLWVELPTDGKVAQYREFVNNYVRDQKKLGRFPRPLYTKITPMLELFDELNVVPRSVKSMSVVSLLFLVVCSLNLVGLLLGKFLARVPEVSVRRALGASKWQVFWQHVVECELVGVAGGAIGLVLSLGVLALIKKFLPFGDVIALDWEMVAMAIFLSLGAGLLAGVYPSWRVSSVAPAMQLKVQ
ncbi:MAG TPA: ABC transporter permease [Thermoanaerobaculia bacterium]|jgi:putative ABC transport system permease protein